MGRPCFQFTLHDAEAFLYLPSLMTDFDDLLWVILKVGIECIESIVFFFFRYPLRVNGKEGMFRNLAVIRNRSLFHKPSVIVLIVLFGFDSSVRNGFSGPFNLTIAYGTLILLIFQRECYDQFFLETALIDPALLVKHRILESLLRLLIDLSCDQLGKIILFSSVTITDVPPLR